MKTPILVRDIGDLRDRVKTGRFEYAIALNGGAYSRKTIRPKGKRWGIHNHIDDSRQVLTDEQLWEESNIGQALDNGALYELV